MVDPICTNDKPAAKIVEQRLGQEVLAALEQEPGTTGEYWEKVYLKELNDEAPRKLPTLDPLPPIGPGGSNW